MERLIDTLKKTYRLSALPAYQSKYCISASSLGSLCDVCVDLCPEKLFTGGRKSKKPDFTKCTKCGICVAVCPAKAIAPIDAQVRTYLMALAKSEEITAGCVQHEAGWSVSCECLAALSWEQIACAALKNGIALYTGACPDCKRQDCAAKVIETIAKVKTFLGDDLFFDKVQLLEQGDCSESRGNAISRRDLLTFFKRMPLDTAVNMLPQLPAEHSELFYRALLHNLISERYAQTPKAERTRYTVALPSITDSCTFCGVCERACPERALAIQRAADGTKFMTVETWKCVSCGKCARSCGKKAIDGMADMSVPYLGAVLLKRQKKETTV